MWAEFIIPSQDLVQLLEQALPLTISFSASNPGHAIELSDLAEARLVANRGLRVVCKAHVTWPVLGVSVPVAVKSVTLLVLPTIGSGPQGDVLTFRLSIEHADFTGVPAMFDDRITDAINAKLAEKDLELSWNFSRALTYLAKLPALLEPLESFAIRPAWGEVRVTEEAVVYAASFHTALVRRGDHPPDDVVSSVTSAAAQPPSDR